MNVWNQNKGAQDKLSLKRAACTITIVTTNPDEGKDKESGYLSYIKKKKHPRKEIDTRSEVGKQ